ncbi:MAG: hypothetical protein E3J35_03590 [Methanomassiliicoccales archaeon]|nr:MAG: hypothetical protein E3J35_03590 [Methanomassiliicoccales archaeon]
MIIPKHCREVGIWRVDFRLDASQIRKSLKGKKAYKRTRYVVLNNKKQHAVVELKKKETKALFNEILSTRIISLPKDTAYVEDPDVDVLSVPLLARRASRSKKDTVVVKGIFEHVSFVHKLRFREIRVVDLVPPFPSKLTTLVEMALKTEEIETPVRIIEELIDIRKLAKRVRTKEILFGCEAGGVRIPKKKCLYIDQNPEIADATIVGCDLTKRVAKQLYGKELPFVDICPKSLVKKSKIPTLIKCCELQTSGFDKEGKIAMVPWGAKVSDVVGAMKYLLGEKR